MKHTTTRRLIAACSATAALLGLAVSAHASLVTSSFAGTVVDFSQFSGGFASGTGPVAVGGLVGESIDWSSSSSDAVIGSGSYGLAGNGNWGSGRGGYTGLNNTSAPGQYTQFIFNNGPVSSVGGFVNYCTAPGAQQCDPAQQFIIEALDGANNAIETYNVSMLAAISTPSGSDAGAFRGIVRANSDIYGFRLYNAVHVLDDLTFTRNSVPEPATLALVGLTLVGLGASRRRRAV